MSTIRLNITGMEEWRKNLRKVHKRAGNGYSIGLGRALKFLKEESNKVAPVLDGNLIEESEIQTNGSGFNREGGVVYGPPGSHSADYALRQHEEYEEKREPDRQWKYLEEPFRNNVDTISEIIQDAVAQSLSKVGL